MAVIQQVDRTNDLLKQLFKQLGTANVSNANVEVLLTTINEALVYDNWTTIAGNIIEYTYTVASTPGTDADNPSGNAGNLSTKVYKDSSETIVLTQTYSYDSNDNIIKVVAS